jgi:phosphoribosylanthranilate isomerase
VKICGTTNLEDALSAVEAGADAVGFVFYEQSPRYVTPEVARKMVRELPAGIETVGVFVNEPRVEEIADLVGLSAMQLHGEEYRGPGPVSTRKVYLTMPARLVAGDGWYMKFSGTPSAILVDSGTAQQRGGTGTAFDWAEAKKGIATLSQGFPVIVAGGLTPGNVAEMMAVLKPWGVDVVSGVEQSPGKKDPGKMKAFVAAVRGADRER